MPLAHKKGDTVKQVVPVISGTVKDVTVVEGEPQFVVEYVGVDGEKHERVFKEDELEQDVKE